MQYSCIISHLLSSPERGFRDIQIVIIANFVVVSNVGIKEGRLYFAWMSQLNQQTFFYEPRTTDQQVQSDNVIYSIAGLFGISLEWIQFGECAD